MKSNTNTGYGPERRLTPLRVRRLSHGLSQANLAAAAGVSRHTVISLEKGGLPKLRTARAIAQTLRCEVLDLFPELLPEADR